MKPGIIEEELNRETPLSGLASDFTQNELFYKRNHFPSPELDPRYWRLKVNFDSKVFEFALDDLSHMEHTAVGAILECAGNGRSGFGTKIEGEIEWGTGAVGNALWSGVPVCALLEKCGVAKKEISKISEALFLGADGSSRADEPIESKKRYVRSLPMDKVLDPETVVAISMNGAPLPKDHGFPARLIVPGYYAMASVKWLEEIRFGRTMPSFRGHFNATKYVYVTEDPNGSSKIEPVTKLRVKSMITDMNSGKMLRVGEQALFAGKAWSGHGRIKEVVVDFGEGWKQASLSQKQETTFSWVNWSIAWIPRRSGRLAIRVRATDESGNQQSEMPYLNRYLYGYNAIQQFDVEVG